MLGQGEATKQAPMVYRPESGLSDTDYLKIACQQNTSFESCWQGKGNAGNLTFTRINIREGLDIWDFEHLLYRKIEITTRECPAIFSFSFCLQGKTADYYDTRKKRFEISAGQQRILYMFNTDNTSYLPAEIPFRQIGIFVSPDCLSAWLGNDPDLLPNRLWNILEKKPDDLFCHTRKINPAAYGVLAQMINCPYTGIAQKLFMESRALELICHQLEMFSAGNNETSRITDASRPVHPDELKKIRRIQERIHDSPETVHSLIALAREVGMSQSKLSRSFRRVYGLTVFEYLKNIRLNQAAAMLDQGMTVTETALSIGYENLSHFSKVFKKRFGELPSRFRYPK